MVPGALPQLVLFTVHDDGCNLLVHEDEDGREHRWQDGGEDAPPLVDERVDDPAWAVRVRRLQHQAERVEISATRTTQVVPFLLTSTLYMAGPSKTRTIRAVSVHRKQLGSVTPQLLQEQRGNFQHEKVEWFLLALQICSRLSHVTQPCAAVFKHDAFWLTILRRGPGECWNCSSHLEVLGHPQLGRVEPEPGVRPDHRHDRDHDGEVADDSAHLHRFRHI